MTGIERLILQNQLAIMSLIALDKATPIDLSVDVDDVTEKIAVCVEQTVRILREEQDNGK